MKNSYPVIFSPDDSGYLVYVPGFDVYTQGSDLTEAIEMARDVIGLTGIVMEDEQKPLPEPSALADVSHQPDDIITLVDVDFREYRRRNELRTVKKNCTLPSWLCHEAEKANINFSAVLQEALKQQLHIS